MLSTSHLNAVSEYTVVPSIFHNGIKNCVVYSSPLARDTVNGARWFVLEPYVKKSSIEYAH